MVLKTIYIARHGYRANWLPIEEQPPNPTGIDSDPPLAPHGVDQAIEMGEWFSKIEKSKQPKLIFTSPFYRCVETATPTAKSLNLDIFLERGIGEWYKPDRGIIPQPADYTRLSKFFDNLSNDWDWATVVPSTDGETEADIFKRSQLFWTKFLPKFEKTYPDVESILFVTHAATKIALGMSLLHYNGTRDLLKIEDRVDEVKNDRLQASTCSVDQYNFEPNVNDWKIILNGYVGFLSGGAEMNWHFATSQFEAGSKEDIESRRRQREEQDRVNAVASARQQKL